jgi:hypothetical protein
VAAYHHAMLRCRKRGSDGLRTHYLEMEILNITLGYISMRHNFWQIELIIQIFELFRYEEIAVAVVVR